MSESSRDPSHHELGRFMEEGGVPLDARQLDKLWRFHVLLRAADAKLNLTRIRAFEAMAEKHYIDSLLPGEMVRLEGPIMDLGSGGGFPGIPLAIMHPELQFKLVEGRRLRAGFLLNTVDALSLKNVEVVARKLNPEDQIPVHTVITRAFSAIDETLERVAQSVPNGGACIFMKGPNCDEEIAAAKKISQWKLEQDKAYHLPFSGDARRLLVYRKITAVKPQRPHTEIVSADNSRIKLWRKLQSAKSIRKEGLALLAGERYILELAAAKPEVILALVATDPAALPDEPDSAERIVVSKEAMRELDAVSGTGPLAIVRAMPLATWPGTLTSPGITLLLATQLPDNVGAILRAAEGLGVRDAVLLAECANPYLPKALRAAGPAPWRMQLWEGPTLAELGNLKLPLAALDVHGAPLDDFAARPSERLGLIVGMEGPGIKDLSPNISRVTIPLAKGVDSLNAAVAAGIALYALGRNRP